MKLVFKFIAAAAVMGAVPAASNAGAQSITYTGSDSQAGIGVSYSITTDGTLGTLGLSNILSSSVTFTPTSAAAYPVITPSYQDGTLYFSNTSPDAISPVSASLTDLSFDFGNMGGLNICAGNLCYALAARGINDGDAVVYNHGDLATREIDDLDVTSNLTPDTYTVVEPTVQSFATAVPTASVPEPASWAMMILGVGAVGYAMRRRKAAVRVSCAA